jgi:hypothetical protein
MVRTLLYLQPGELRRLAPFFGLYLLLFAGLSLADGLALTLFVEHVGPDKLPTSYGIIAVLNLLIMAVYIWRAERTGSVRVFQNILLATVGVFFVAWIAIRFHGGGKYWFGLMFVTREISFTLFLMHFGTYLQDYFSRAELNRVLPIVYSGGRVGGILGGSLLENLSEPVGLLNLPLVFVALGLVSLAMVHLISWRFPAVHAPEDEHGDPGIVPAGSGASLESQARTSVAGFLRFVWASPLLYWTTVTSILFMICRWVLNYQYSTFFAHHFPDELSLARFLGKYTQIALAVSLIVQLLVVNRLVAWIGLKGTHLTYSILLVSGVAVNMLPMTLAMAIFARVVETELRFGLRNPITQMITNKFSKALRVRVRAWSIGVLNPLATLMASVLLSGLAHNHGVAWIPWMGGLAGLSYFLGSLGLYKSLGDKTQDRQETLTVHSQRITAHSPNLNHSAAVCFADRQTNRAPAAPSAH